LIPRRLLRKTTSDLTSSSESSNFGMKDVALFARGSTIDSQR